MDLSEYLWMFVKAYNPNQYEKLLERPLRTFISFFLLVVALCFLIFIILIIPITYNYIASIPSRTAEVQSFKLDADVQADHAVTLLERPSITLDLGANGTRSSDFTITNEGMLYPKYIFFGTNLVAWKDIKDLKQQTPERDRLLATITLFILPSIIFWFFLYSMLKAALIFLILLLLGYVLPRLFRHAISVKDVAKLTLLTMPSLIIMDFALYPLAPLFWWGLLLTAVLFFVGLAMLSELTTEESEHKHRGKV